jgi:hypothetical protein
MPKLTEKTERTKSMKYGDLTWTKKAQSVERIAMGWTVQGSNPGGSGNFRIRPERPYGYRVSLLGVKGPGSGVYHPPHLAPRLKKE